MELGRRRKNCSPVYRLFYKNVHSERRYIQRLDLLAGWHMSLPWDDGALRMLHIWGRMVG